MIVFLTEEESMRVTLERLGARFWPNKLAGVDWIALSFQGKADLEKNILPKMRHWRYGKPHFIILRDQDGDNCQSVKSNITARAELANHPFSVRVVCNELESWFLGELEAVELAFPDSKAGKQLNSAKFRDPDALANASQELERLTRVPGKVGRADAIANFFIPEKCRSHSFQVFWKTITNLLSLDEAER